MPLFLGVDVGSSKTHMAIAGEDGRVIAFGRSGAGNYQVVGYAGMLAALEGGLQQLGAQGFPRDALAGAGFGVAGYDWPSDSAPLRGVIDQLNLGCSYAMVNDALPPLLASARDAWGVSLVSGTGCNCRGWDQERRREGAVTGFGTLAGEGAGASEIVFKAMHHVAYAWTQRGPRTALADAFIRYAAAADLADLLEGYCKGRYAIDAGAAPLVFAAGREGDLVAREVIRWAGVELGELANAVIRQLEIAGLAFDVVLSGSMFDGGPLLTDPLAGQIARLAPRARIVHMDAPPVAGALLLAMEQVGLRSSAELRRAVSESTVSQR